CMVVERFESRRCLRKRQGAVMWTIEWIGKLVVGNIGPNAPISSFTRAALIGIDHLPLAQRAHLIIDQVENPVCVARPIALGFLLRLQFAPAITDKHCLIAFPYCLQTEIVVDSAVGEKHMGSKRFTLQIMTRIRSE